MAGDDFEDLDLDLDFDTEINGVVDENPDGRNPVITTSRDTAASFVESFTDNKTQSLLDIGRAALPPAISSETDIITTAYDNMSDEISKQGAKLSREAKRSIKTIKRFLPGGDDGVLGKLANKASKLLGDDPSVASSGPTQAERIAEEINLLMGVKGDQEAFDKGFKEQLEFTRQKDVKDLQTSIAVNSERMRKFMFEVSDKYYRTDINISLRQLYSAEELLAVTKTGFDVFKSSLEAIIKNTALPEYVKIKDAELVGKIVKEKFISNIGTSLFKSDTPIDRIVNKTTSVIKQYSSSAVDVLQQATGFAEQTGGLGEAGIGVGDMLGMVVADIAKSKGGEFAGKIMGKEDTTKELVHKIKTALADPEAALAEFERSGEAGSSFAGFLKTLSGSSKKNFSVDRLDPNASAYIDNRTKDSINKVIPGLLAKIYGELKTTRELQTKLGGSSLETLNVSSPVDNELTYDHDVGGLITKKQLRTSINSKFKEDAYAGVAPSANAAVRIFLTNARHKFSRSDTKIIRDALMRTVMTTGKKSDKVFKENSFIRLIEADDSELAGRVVSQYRIFHREMTNDPDLLETLHSYLSSILRSTSRHESVAKDLVDRGMTDEALNLGLITRNKSGDLIGDRKSILNDMVNKASSADITTVNKDDEESIKDKLKGASFKEGLGIIAKGVADDVNSKLEEPKKNNGGELGSYSSGGYTKDGKWNKISGLVHHGEYVLDEKMLDSIMSSAKDGDSSSTFDVIKKIVSDVSSQSKKYSATTYDVMSKMDNFLDSGLKLQSDKDPITLESLGEKFTEVMSSSIDVVGKRTADIFGETFDGLNEALVSGFKSAKESVLELSKLSVKDVTEYAKDKYSGSPIESGVKLAGETRAGKHITGLAKEFKGSDTYKNILKSGEAARDFDYNSLFERDEEIASNNNAMSEIYKQYGLENEVPVTPTIMTSVGDYAKSLGDKAAGMTSDELVAGFNIYKETVSTSIDSLSNAVKSSDIGKKLFNTNKELSDHNDSISSLYKQYGVQDEVPMEPTVFSNAVEYAKSLGERGTGMSRFDILDEFNSYKESGSEKFGAGRDKFYKIVDDGKRLLDGMDPNFIGPMEKTNIFGYGKKAVSIASDKTQSYFNDTGKLIDSEYIKGNSELSAIQGLYPDDNGVDKDPAQLWDDLSEELQSGLRLEFFSSYEYKAKLISSFPLWIRDFKRIDPGSLGSRSGILSSGILNVKNRLLSPIIKMRDEITKELTDKLTGKSLKELTKEQDASMLQVFYSSEEFKNGSVTDYQEWLRSQGIQRNGKSVIGRIKKFITSGELFRKTRSIDRMVMGGFYKGAIKHTLKSPWYAAKAAYKTPKALWKVGGASVRGIRATGRLAGFGSSHDGDDRVTEGRSRLRRLDRAIVGGGLYSAGKHIIKSPYYALKGGYNAAKFGIGAAGAIIKGTGILPESLDGAPRKDGWDKLLDYFKGRDKKVNAKEVLKNKKVIKERKRSRFLSMFKSDDDSDTGGRKRSSRLMRMLRKGKEFLNPATVLLGIAGAVAAFGITSEDIKSGVKDTVDVIKGIKDVISPMWGTFKDMLGFLKKSFTYITQIPDRLSISMRDSLSTVPMLKWLKPDASELDTLDGKLHGTIDSEGNKIEGGDESVGNIEALAVAAGGGALAYGAYKGSRMVGSAVRGGGKTYSATKGIINGVSRAPSDIHGPSLSGKPGLFSRIGGFIGRTKDTLIRKLSPSASKLLTKLKGFIGTIKDKIISKFGKKMGGKLLIKLALRATPLGLPLLLGTLAYYLSIGTAFASSASLAVIGVDLFADDDGVDISIDPASDVSDYVSKSSGNNVVGINTVYTPMQPPKKDMGSLGNTTNNIIPLPLERIREKRSVGYKNTRPESINISSGSNRATNSAGIELIKRFEGLKLRAYQDSVGIWTIGYGHTRGVAAGQVITGSEAGSFLKSDLRSAESDVERLVTVPINDNEFAALVSFTFNLGGGKLKSSTLLRQLNGGDYESVPEQLNRWNRAGGKVLTGLVRRRKAEGVLWVKPVGSSSKTPSDKKDVSSRTGDRSNVNTTLYSNDTSTVDSKKDNDRPQRRRVNASNRNSAISSIADYTNGKTTPGGPVIKIEPIIKVNASVNLDDDKNLPIIADMSTRAVELQTQIVSVLGDISDKLDRSLDATTPTHPNEHSPVPKPVINVSRRKTYN